MLPHRKQAAVALSARLAREDHDRDIAAPGVLDEAPPRSTRDVPGEAVAKPATAGGPATRAPDLASRREREARAADGADALAKQLAADPSRRARKHPHR